MFLFLSYFFVFVMLMYDENNCGDSNNNYSYMDLY